MKKYIFFLMAMLTFVLMGCSSNGKPEKESIFIVGTDSDNNGKGIEWFLLEETEDEYLLMTKQEVNTLYADKTSDWEHSQIRLWLNNEFYEKVFDADEKDKICEKRLSNPNSSKYNISWQGQGGKSTYDKVYLLSYEEYKKYKDIIEKNIGDEDDWWLRSPGITNIDTMYVSSGEIMGDGKNDDQKGIHPVIAYKK